MKKYSVQTSEMVSDARLNHNACYVLTGQTQLCFKMCCVDRLKMFRDDMKNSCWGLIYKPDICDVVTHLEGWASAPREFCWCKILRALDLPICALCIVAGQELLWHRRHWPKACAVVGATGRHGTERGNPRHPTFEESHEWCLNCLRVGKNMYFRSLSIPTLCNAVNFYRIWLELLVPGNCRSFPRTF